MTSDTRLTPYIHVFFSRFSVSYWLSIIFVDQMTSSNSLRPRPNRRHFADAIFKCISENEIELISPRISLKFVPKVRINNIPALVQIMAWRRPGDKPLSEPIMVSLLTHICVTRPQWVNMTDGICWNVTALRVDNVKSNADNILICN